MKNIIQNNKLLFILLSLYCISGALILSFFEKGAVELFVNKHHNVYFDYFFLYITYLGDGFFLVLIILIMMWRKIYYGILGIFTILVSTIVVQFMKRMLFADYPRPSRFFQKYLDLHYIEGLELHSFYSFPSGHSSGAFSIFILLALISKNNLQSVLFFVLALLASFSRIYLMQHFFIDTYFGALIGTLVALIVYYFINDRTALPEKKTLQQPLFAVFIKK